MIKNWLSAQGAYLLSVDKGSMLIGEKALIQSRALISVFGRRQNVKNTSTKKTEKADLSYEEILCSHMEFTIKRSHIMYMQFEK